MSNIIEIGGGASGSAVLIPKTITANGVYYASSDSADGYDEVDVNVSGGNAVLLTSNNAFFSLERVTGTNYEAVGRTWTFTEDGVLKFSPSSYARTNTGSNDGYFDFQINGVSILKQFLTTNTDVSLTLNDVSISNGDVFDIIYGFNNYHSNCTFQLYTAISLIY